MTYTLDILEAIQSYYKDDPQLQVEILESIIHNDINTKTVKNTFEGICRDNDICPICLHKLELNEYKEPRPYQEGYADEVMSELVCKNCGWKDN